jgi:hypothetical protein
MSNSRAKGLSLLYGNSCAEVGCYTGHRENIYIISRGIINQLMYLFSSVTVIAIYLFNDTCSHGSSVGRPRNRNSILGRCNRFFSSLNLPDRLLGPSSLSFTGYQWLFLGIKQPGHESDHEGTCWRRGIAPFFLFRGSRWWYLVSFTPRQLYLRE